MPEYEVTVLRTHKTFLRTRIPMIASDAEGAKQLVDDIPTRDLEVSVRAASGWWWGGEETDYDVTDAKEIE